MKTRPALACMLVIFLIRTATRADVAADWIDALETAQQVSGQTSSGRARAGTIVRTAVFAAANGLPGKTKPARPAEAVPPNVSVDAAITQAAYATLAVLYPDQIASLDSQLARSLAELVAAPQAITDGRAWGEHVAKTVLAEHDTAVFLNAFSFAKTSPPLAPAAASPGGSTTIGPRFASAGPGSYTFTVLAGTPGLSGSADGLGTSARFTFPSGLAIDQAGTIYVADMDNATIRKITPDGMVTTLAGLAGSKGSADGIGSVARFNSPGGVATDLLGNVYVADTDNFTIRKITPDGAVTTFAGLAGSKGAADGVGSDARFHLPSDVAMDATGLLIVADGYYPDGKLRRITTEQAVSTLVIPSAYGAYGFSFPSSVATDPAGNLYVLDYDELFGNFLLKYTLTVNGGYSLTQLDPPPGQTYYFSGDEPTAMTADASGNLIVIRGTGELRKFTPDGTRISPSVFGSPVGVMDIVANRDGNLYAVAWRSHTILKGVFNPNGIALTRQPADQTVSTGETAVFSVEATGDPAPTYQWYRNSVPITGATSPMLNLDNVQAADHRSTYSVIVSDGVNRIGSTSATLLVNGVSSPPPAPPPSPLASSGGGGVPSGWFLGALALLAAARRWHGLTTSSRGDSAGNLSP